MRKLWFPSTRPQNVNNRYVIGSGVGAKSQFVRRALRSRASSSGMTEDGKFLPCVASCVASHSDLAKHKTGNTCSVQSIAAALEWSYKSGKTGTVIPLPKNAPKWIVVSSSQTGQVRLVSFQEVYINHDNTVYLGVDSDTGAVGFGILLELFESASLMNNDWSQFARFLLSETGLPLREIDPSTGTIIPGGKTTQLKIIACGF